MFVLFESFFYFPLSFVGLRGLLRQKQRVHHPSGEKYPTGGTIRSGKIRVLHNQLQRWGVGQRSNFDYLHHRPSWCEQSFSKSLKLRVTSRSSRKNVSEFCGGKMGVSVQLAPWLTWNYITTVLCIRSRYRSITIHRYRLPILAQIQLETQTGHV